MARKTIYGNKYDVRKEVESPTGIYYIRYGEYSDTEYFYFSSYERAVRVMNFIAKNEEWGDTIVGPFPLYLDDKNDDFPPT